VVEPLSWQASIETILTSRSFHDKNQVILILLEAQMNSKEVWESRISEWESSGESLSGYCKRTGIAYSSIGYWRRRLGKIPTRPDFIPVRINQEPVFYFSVDQDFHISFSIRLTVKI